MDRNADLPDDTLVEIEWTETVVTQHRAQWRLGYLRKVGEVRPAETIPDAFIGETNGPLSPLLSGATHSRIGSPPGVQCVVTGARVVEAAQSRPAAG